MYKIFDNSVEYSGNNSTLNRLSNILSLKLTKNIENNIIGIHAYKFGKLVINNNINFILIIGGTDINIDINDINKKSIIIKACKEAKYIITFNKFIKDNVLLLLDNNKNKIKIIPQGIEKLPKSYFNLRLYLENKYNLTNINKIFMMVGNLRYVKDPLYLKDIFEKLRMKGIILIQIGKIIDNYFYNQNNSFKGIYYLGSFDNKIINSLYNQVNGLINTSISEGMAGSILEAMLNKCPVFARNNEGNCAIIRNNYNGYIFNSPEEFLKLYNLDTNHIISNAYNYVLKNHSIIDERKSYYKIIDNL